VHEYCDIMIGQLCAIDNGGLMRKVGDLPANIAEKVRENIKIVLELE
jgi:hypothetical protein